MSIQEIHVPVWRAKWIYQDKLEQNAKAAQKINETLPKTGTIRWENDDIYRSLCVQILGCCVFVVLMPLLFIVDFLFKLKTLNKLAEFVEIKKKAYITYEEIHEKLKEDPFWYLISTNKFSAWYDVKQYEIELQKLEVLDRDDIVVLKI